MEKIKNEPLIKELIEKSKFYEIKKNSIKFWGVRGYKETVLKNRINAKNINIKDDEVEIQFV